MTKAGSKIIRGAKEALVYARGEDVEGLVAHVPDAIDVAAVRHATGLSQEAFANRFGFTVGALRDWEQKRRTPERAARILLTIIAREPDAVSRALNAH